MISVQPTIGPFYGNVPINVVGKMFGLKPENQTVTIGGVACPSTRYVSSELLQCDLPPGSGISQDVSVIVDNQSVSGGDLFSYQGGGKSFTEQTCSIKSVFVFPLVRYVFVVAVLLQVLRLRLSYPIRSR